MLSRMIIDDTRDKDVVHAPLLGVDSVGISLLPANSYRKLTFEPPLHVTASRVLSIISAFARGCLCVSTFPVHRPERDSLLSSYTRFLA